MRSGTCKVASPAALKSITTAAEALSSSWLFTTSGPSKLPKSQALACEIGSKLGSQASALHRSCRMACLHGRGTSDTAGILAGFHTALIIASTTTAAASSSRTAMHRGPSLAHKMRQWTLTLATTPITAKTMLLMTEHSCLMRSWRKTVSVLTAIAKVTKTQVGFELPLPVHLQTKPAHALACAGCPGKRVGSACSRRHMVIWIRPLQIAHWRPACGTGPSNTDSHLFL